MEEAVEEGGFADVGGAEDDNFGWAGGLLVEKRGEGVGRTFEIVVGVGHGEGGMGSYRWLEFVDCDGAGRMHFIVIKGSKRELTTTRDGRWIGGLDA